MAQKAAKVNISLAENSVIIVKGIQEDISAMRMIASARKEDSAAMRTIAAESKKDSSAMKTVSILGTIFLPDTFVAANLLVSNISFG
jgi:Mg2+ and Co2+ transporter CorA